MKLKLIQDDSLEQVCGGGDYWGTFAGTLTAFAVAVSVKYGYDVLDQHKYEKKNENPSLYNDWVKKGVNVVSSVEKKVSKLSKLSKLFDDFEG